MSVCATLPDPDRKLLEQQSGALHRVSVMGCGGGAKMTDSKLDYTA